MSDPPPPGPPAPEPPPVPGPPPGTGRGRGRAEPGRGDLSLQVLALAAEVAGLRADLAEVTARLPGPAGSVGSGVPAAVADLQADVDELRAQVTLVSETVLELATAQPAGENPAPPGICWADLDAAGRAEALGRVRDWVYEVLMVWHPEVRTKKVLRPCWYRHPDVLSDTAALYEVWCWAYRDPDASPGRREEWHASWLPDWITRTKDANAQRECQGGHDPRPVPPLGPDWTDGFDEYAAWFADPRGEREPPAPPRR